MRDLQGQDGCVGVRTKKETWNCPIYSVIIQNYPTLEDDNGLARYLQKVFFTRRDLTDSIQSQEDDLQYKWE